MPVFITSEAYTSEPVFVKSCSSAYAGLVTRVTVGDSTTNLILPNVTAQFRLKKFRWFQYLGVLNEEKMNATDQVATNDERYEFG